MTTFAWPSTWLPNRFEMRLKPNVVTFTSPYTKSTQALDFLGDRWYVIMDLPPDIDQVLGAAREAFFDRLQGPVNLTSLWHLQRPQPQGTLRDSASGTMSWQKTGGGVMTWQKTGGGTMSWKYGAPVLAANVAQLANILPIATSPGTTLLAGDQIGVGGLLFRVMANATADSHGTLSVEVQPRARTALGVGLPIVTYQPTANFMLMSDGVPVPWRPGLFDSTTVELVESF